MTDPRSTMEDPEISRRKEAMATVAGAKAEALAKAFAPFDGAETFELIRPPETGLIMTRGRMGGTGAAFNLGEVTTTRCVIRLSNGITGHAYIMGRNKTKALQAAVVDALWQSPAHRTRIEAGVIAPLAEAATEADETVKAETAATKVDFFTMVRGDD